MTIKVGKDWELVPDGYNWKCIHLRDGVNPKTKEKTRVGHPSYHATLEQAARYILDNEVKTEKSLDGLISALSRVHSELKRSLTPETNQKVRRRLRSNKK